MLKTYLYIPEHLEKKINLKAEEEKRSKAEVIRETLEGLRLFLGWQIWQRR
jgi:hypothetical protein